VLHEVDQFFRAVGNEVGCDGVKPGIGFTFEAMLISCAIWWITFNARALVWFGCGSGIFA
jgi:hypothetical protein